MKRPARPLPKKVSHVAPQHLATVFATFTQIRTRPRLGRIGGMKNRHSVVDDYSAPLPPLDNALSLRDALARMIADLHSKKLHPRTAAGLATLSKTLLRAIEVVNANDMERRIAKLEQLVEAAELSKNGNESGSVHTTSPTTANEPPRPNGVPRVPEEET